MARQDGLQVDGLIVKKRSAARNIARFPHAAGSDAPRRWANRVASSSNRCVCRALPNSASINSVTAQASSSGMAGIAHPLVSVPPPTDGTVIMGL
jgi:hypothetical protein